MESLADVLRRLAATRRAQNGDARSNGFERPEPQCALCQDLGWTTPDVPPGDPDFGRRLVCQCQRPRIELERHDRLVRYSNLANLTRSTFDTLDPHGRAGDPESRGLFAMAREAAQRFAESAEGWLLISGPNGSGKTHLAAAIANRIIERGRPALFVHVPDLLDHLRAAFSPQAEISYDDLFEQVRNAPLLVLDELGSHSATPWAEEKLRQIINHRFTASLPTVVTTTAQAPRTGALPARSADRPPFECHRPHPPRLRAVAPPLGRDRPRDAPPHDLRIVRRARQQGQSPSSGLSLQEALRASVKLRQVPGRLAHPVRTHWRRQDSPGRRHCARAHETRATRCSSRIVLELLDNLRSAFDRGSTVSFGEIFEQVKNAPLLILDGLGDESDSAWGQEKLYQVVVRRHNARLPTIINANEDFSQGFVASMGSRLRDSSLANLYMRMLKLPTTDNRGPIG